MCIPNKSFSRNNLFLDLTCSCKLLSVEICRHHGAKSNNYLAVKLTILYNAQLNVSHFQKWYQKDISFDIPNDCF
jgi:hypothetical protein